MIRTTLVLFCAFLSVSVFAQVLPKSTFVVCFSKPVHVYSEYESLLYTYHVENPCYIHTTDSLTKLFVLFGMKVTPVFLIPGYYPKPPLNFDYQANRQILNYLEK